MRKIHDIFKMLRGTWTLQRTIPGYGSVHGIAYFRNVQKNILHYSEKGIFTILSKEGRHTIEREYFYCYDETNNKISVYFSYADKVGCLLHDLDFRLLSLKAIPIATGLHKCKQDTYEANYSFLSNHHFKLIYIVKGLSKNYISETHFAKLI